MQRPGLASGRSVIGHNEDGAPENVGQCALLTLALDGLPTVTAFWYPGFLPTNAFTVTADGLVWTIDHLPVAEPGAGAGRYFVGRDLQRTATTVDQVIDGLRTNPSARGFAYTIGDRTGRIVNVEAAAGDYATVEVGPDSSPLLWHTNHGRYISGCEAPPGGTSVARGEILDALSAPADTRSMSSSTRPSRAGRERRRRSLWPGRTCGRWTSAGVIVWLPNPSHVLSQYLSATGFSFAYRADGASVYRPASR